MYNIKMIYYSLESAEKNVRPICAGFVKGMKDMFITWRKIFLWICGKALIIWKKKKTQTNENFMHKNLKTD